MLYAPPPHSKCNSEGRRGRGLARNIDEAVGNPHIRRLPYAMGHPLPVDDPEIKRQMPRTVRLLISNINWDARWLE
jgi:hypothetical protein